MDEDAMALPPLECNPLNIDLQPLPPMELQLIDIPLAVIDPGPFEPLSLDLDALLRFSLFDSNGANQDNAQTGEKP
jgi:hypothetical protein